MRNIEPPTGRGWASKFLLIVRRREPKSEMNRSIGSFTSSSYRCLLASNQDLLLLAWSSFKNRKSPGPKRAASARLVSLRFAGIMFLLTFGPRAGYRLDKWAAAGSTAARRGPSPPRRPLPEPQGRGLLGGHPRHEINPAPNPFP